MLIKTTMRWIVTFFLMEILASANLFGQDTPSQYYLVILKKDCKTEILPSDTMEFSLCLSTDKKANIFLYYDDSNGCWLFHSQSQNRFKDFIHYRIINSIDTMDILLKYDCSVWSYPNTKTSDTIVFTKGKFVFNEKKDFNYWKRLVRQNTTDNSKAIKTIKTKKRTRTTSYYPNGNVNTKHIILMKRRKRYNMHITYMYYENGALAEYSKIRRSNAAIDPGRYFPTTVVRKKWNKSGKRVEKYRCSFFCRLKHIGV